MHFSFVYLIHAITPSSSFTPFADIIVRRIIIDVLLKVLLVLFEVGNDVLCGSHVCPSVCDVASKPKPLDRLI
jgi:hypothetical protein